MERTVPRASLNLRIVALSAVAWEVGPKRRSPCEQAFPNMKYKSIFLGMLERLHVNGGGSLQLRKASSFQGGALKYNGKNLGVLYY
jgi:pyrimidine deaminase RibD-like protein